MVKQAIIAFFRPILLIIILTAAMLGITVPAQFQSWRPDHPILGETPKPPFYDELRPYPFHLIYSYLMIPFALVAATGWILSLYGLYDVPIDITNPVGAILHVVYFYLLSCFVVLIYRNIKDDKTWQQRAHKIKSS